MLIHEALSDYLLAIEANGLKATTIKWYTSLLTAFADYFTGKQLSDLSARDIRKYIVDLEKRDQRYIDAPQKPTQDGGLAYDSIKGHITALHAFWRWCALEYKLDNPMANIKRRKRKQPEIKAIDKDDFVKMFNSTGGSDIGKRDRAILAFFADTGCRLGGLLSVELKWLNLPDRTAFVVEKGDKMRKVHFTRLTADLIQQWLDVRNSTSSKLFTSLTKERGALTSSGVHQVFERLKGKAGVKGRVNPHRYRHRFAIEYLTNGGDEITLAKLMGDHINTIYLYYTNFSQDELAKQHERFSPLKSIMK